MDSTVENNKEADENSNMGDINIVPVKEENKPQTESTPGRKNMKEEKARKKDDRNVEQVLKALNSLDTPEEKLAAMCKKYADTVDENRKLQLSLKQTEKRLVNLQREKEQLQTEYSKAVLTRSRLESLCRELQRQNKAVKEESLLKIREEEEKRREVSAKFQATLADVTTLMQQNNEKNCKLREDNLEMTKKFKSVCEQYEKREQQVDKISQQLQLESQLADAKMTQVKMEMAAEKEVLLREKQQLLMEVVESQAKIKDLQATEANLRSQITLYTDKFDEFQGALSRSNDVFAGFKGEMERMSKKICKLEKETSSWKQRWEKSHQSLLEMAADKQQRDSELQLASRQLLQLQKLCRTLQAERTSLLAQVKAQSNGGVENVEKIEGDDNLDVVEQNLDSLISQTEHEANLQHTESSVALETSQQPLLPAEPAVTMEKIQQQTLLESSSAPEANPQPVLQAEPLVASKTIQEQVSESETSLPSQIKLPESNAPVVDQPQIIQPEPLLASAISQQPALQSEMPSVPAEAQPPQPMPPPANNQEAMQPSQPVVDGTPESVGDSTKEETAKENSSVSSEIPESCPKLPSEVLASQTDQTENCAGSQVQQSTNSAVVIENREPEIQAVQETTVSSPQSSPTKKSKEIGKKRKK